MNEHKKASKLSLIFADDIMTEDVVVINQNMTVGQVAHLMLRERVSGYPIVDADGKVIGIVTLTDLFKLVNELTTSEGDLNEQISECKNKLINTIMSGGVFTIAPNTPVTEIVQAVIDSNIHTFPVMDGDKLVGIIGRHDVLNAVFVYG